MSDWLDGVAQAFALFALIALGTTFIAGALDR